jgi:hypothetical protein
MKARISQCLDASQNNIVYGIRKTYDHIFEYRYVGLTSRGVERLDDHLRLAKGSSRKTSEDLYLWITNCNFQITFDILEICQNSSELDFTEKKWIRILRDKGHRLLNRTSGGQGTFGYSFSESHRKNLSIATSGENHWAYGGGKFSEEHRANLSKALSGENNPMFGRTGELSPRFGKPGLAGEDNPMFGKTHSKEVRAKISQNLKNNPPVLSDIGRSNISKSSKLNAHTRWHVNRNKPNSNCIYCRNDNDK